MKTPLEEFQQIFINVLEEVINSRTEDIPAVTEKNVETSKTIPYSPQKSMQKGH